MYNSNFNQQYEIIKRKPRLHKQNLDRMNQVTDLIVAPLEQRENKKDRNALPTA
jgi:hypothetical protein